MASQITVETFRICSQPIGPHAINKRTEGYVKIAA